MTVILAKLHQLNMTSESYLKDFMRAGMLKIDYRLEDRQESIKKKSMKLMIFFKLIQAQVFDLLPKSLRYHKQQQHIEL